MFFQKNFIRNQTYGLQVAGGLFETKLNFIKPFKSTADGYVKLKKDGEGTITTWGFKSQMPYPMNLMKLFMNFEKSMDKEFGDGLNKLKEICSSK